MRKKIIISILSLILNSFLYSKTLDNIKELNKNWSLKQSSKVNSEPEEISSPSYIEQLWFKTDIPKTVFATLVENGVYRNVFFSKNLINIKREPFRSPWWYRKTFYLNKIESKKFAELIFKGINFRADIWLNGIKISDSKETYGAFRIFQIDITGKLKEGKNVIAVKVYPPKRGDLTIGFVDWNPPAPDNNMGIWRGVELKLTNSLNIKNIYIKTELNTKTLKDAALSIKAKITNKSKKTITGEAVVEIPEAKIKIKKRISLKALEEKALILSSEEFKELLIKNPKLWWPHNIGKPKLYTLKFYLINNGNISDKKTIKFGIRKIEDYINKEGFKGYKINGKKILIKGGGWVDDMLLREDKEKLLSQINYIKSMGLNAIRLEGFWGESEVLYNLCDENGILIMAGFSCQWEWENLSGKPADKFGSIKAKSDIQLAVDYLKSQVMWLRNHPSIFVWLLGSDKLPRPELERRYLSLLKDIDPQRPILSAAKEFKSVITGKTAVKMRGPYAYVPPVYWYKDKKKGGAFGFNTETSSGAVVPEKESILKMIPKNKLWPINDEWEFHCARNEFQTLDRYYKAIKERYGEPKDFDEFVKKAQMLNYELSRAMFEAFSVNRYTSTGIIQWMLNSSWPKMYWQLYDWYLMPTGAFYGTMHANKSVHIVYRYGFEDIFVVNENLTPLSNLKAKIKVINSKSQVIMDKEILIKSLPANSKKRILKKIKKPKRTKLFFLQLKLLKNKKEIDDNFYWLSKVSDKVNFSYKNENTDWFITPTLRYGDFKEINYLKTAAISISKRTGSSKIKLSIKNISNQIAFFITLKAFNKITGEIITPAYFSDNYVSILPEEEKIIAVSFKRNVHLKDVILKISGWNTKTYLK